MEFQFPLGLSMVFSRRRDIGFVAPFPQELVDLIIDLLREDASTLKTCAIVCKKWTHRCRIHLFHTITVDLTPSILDPRYTPDDALDAKLSLFQQVLTSSPRLKQHIHIVELRNLQWRSEKREDSFGVLTNILMSLRHVENLSLRNLRWYNCPESLKSAISHLLQLPTIERIEFRGFAVRERLSLMRLLTLSPNLKYLHLKGIECRDYHRGDESTDEQKTPPIRELSEFYIDATHCSCLFNWILAPNSSFSLGNLTALHISDGCRPNFAEQLLRLAGPSLVHLELGMGNTFDSNSININLNNLPKLQSLELAAETSISLIQKLFGNLHQPHPLQEILVIGATPSSGVCNWGILHSHFTQPALEQMRRFLFEIIEENWDDEELEGLYDQFPILEKRDILRIREVGSH